MEIHSKVPNQAFRDNFDRIFGNKESKQDAVETETPDADTPDAIDVEQKDAGV